MNQVLNAWVSVEIGYILNKHQHLKLFEENLIYKAFFNGKI